MPAWEAIEPSVFGTIRDENTGDSSSTSPEETSNKVFIPVKTNKKMKKKTPIDESTTLIKEALKKDPIKDLLVSMREDAKKSRQHDLMLLQSMQQMVPQQTFSQPTPQSVRPHVNQVPVINHGLATARQLSAMQGMSPTTPGMSSTTPGMPSSMPGMPSSIFHGQDQFTTQELYDSSKSSLSYFINRLYVFNYIVG